MSCIPLLANVGFALPPGWVSERGDQGKWTLGLIDASDPKMTDAAVLVSRIDGCTPDSARHPRLHHDFPASYHVDKMVGGESKSDGISTSDTACVKGDKGALIVTLPGHQPRFAAQVAGLLTRIAEATDGQHRCPVR